MKHWKGSGEESREESVVDDEDAVDEADPEPLVRDPGDGALASVAVPGGYISMYRDIAKDELYVRAVCECGHGKNCRKARTLEISKRSKRAQGRPCGFLTAWLAAGMEPLVGDEYRHKWRTRLTRAERVHGRRVFEAAEGSEAILDRERDEDSADEDGEPLAEP